MQDQCPHCDNQAPHTIEKYCTKCETMVPHPLMAAHSQSKDGLRTLCKVHWAAYMREAYAANPTAWNARSGAYKKAHRAEISAKETARRHERMEDPLVAEEERERGRRNTARWTAENPEKAKASCARYAAANSDKINARRRARYAENPEKPLANNKKRKARIRGALQNDLTAAQWNAIKEHYGHRCVYCGRKMQRLTQDHLTPVSQGGAHTLSNVVPACQSCNAKKHAGPVLIPVQPLLLL